MIDISIDFSTLQGIITDKASKLGVRIHKSILKYNVNGHNGGSEHLLRYPLLQLNFYSEEQPILGITSCFHGMEKSGPFTFANNLEDIVALSKEKNVGLIMYPCINPSGFDLGRRYNIVSPDDDGKPHDGVRLQNFGPNNDFMRYVVNHKLVDDLRNQKKFDSWIYSNDKSIVENLPHETIKMHQLIRKAHLKMIWGQLDIHQDCFEDEILMYQPKGQFEDKRWTYAYIFNKKRLYLPIMQEAGKIVPVLKSSFIDTGYRKKPKIDAQGRKELVTIPDKKDNVYSDDQGFVYRHDGSITDLMFRLNVPYVAAIETSGKTPIDEAVKVNMIWIEGMMELIRKKYATEGKSIS
jgi:hypothetical protein